MIDRLAFAACYAYSPHGISATSSQSRDLCRRIKRADTEAVALATARVTPIRRRRSVYSVLWKRRRHSYPCRVALRWRPGPSAVRNGSVTNWSGRGLGRETLPLIARIRPVAKSAYAAPAERPDAVEHHDSMDVQRTLVTPRRILLVDDVVTRGATLLGAASRLLEAVEHSDVRAFAFIRTISPGEVEDVRDPCEGWIERVAGGGTVRRP